MRPWPLLFLPVLALAATAQNLRQARNRHRHRPRLLRRHQCPRTHGSGPVGTGQGCEQRSARASAAIDMPAGGIVQTALDGSFAIPNVPPGSVLRRRHRRWAISLRVPDAKDTMMPKPHRQPDSRPSSYPGSTYRQIRPQHRHPSRTRAAVSGISASTMAAPLPACTSGIMRRSTGQMGAIQLDGHRHTRHRNHG